MRENPTNQSSAQAELDAAARVRDAHRQEVSTFVSVATSAAQALVASLHHLASAFRSVPSLDPTHGPPNPPLYLPSMGGVAGPLSSLAVDQQLALGLSPLDHGAMLAAVERQMPLVDAHVAMLQMSPYAVSMIAAPVGQTKSQVSLLAGSVQALDGARRRLQAAEDRIEAARKKLDDERRRSEDGIRARRARILEAARAEQAGRLASLKNAFPSRRSAVNAMLARVDAFVRACDGASDTVRRMLPALQKESGAANAALTKAEQLVAAYPERHRDLVTELSGIEALPLTNESSMSEEAAERDFQRSVHRVEFEITDVLGDVDAALGGCEHTSRALTSELAREGRQVSTPSAPSTSSSTTPSVVSAPKPKVASKYDPKTVMADGRAVDERIALGLGRLDGASQKQGAALHLRQLGWKLRDAATKVSLSKLVPLSSRLGKAIAASDATALASTEEAITAWFDAAHAIEAQLAGGLSSAPAPGSGGQRASNSPPSLVGAAAGGPVSGAAAGPGGVATNEGRSTGAATAGSSGRGGGSSVGASPGGAASAVGAAGASTGAGSASSVAPGVRTDNAARHQAAFESAKAATSRLLARNDSVDAAWAALRADHGQSESKSVRRLTERKRAAHHDQFHKAVTDFGTLEREFKGLPTDVVSTSFIQRANALKDVCADLEQRFTVEMRHVKTLAENARAGAEKLSRRERRTEESGKHPLHRPDLASDKVLAEARELHREVVDLSRAARSMALEGYSGLPENYEQQWKTACPVHHLEKLARRLESYLPEEKDAADRTARMIEDWFKVARRLLEEAKGKESSLRRERTRLGIGRQVKTKHYDNHRRRDPFVGLDRALWPAFKDPTELSRSLFGGDTSKYTRRGVMLSKSERLTVQIDRLEKAVNTARPFVPDGHTQLHSAVAAIDAGIAKAKGKSGDALARDTADVARSLGDMANIAKGLGYQSAATLRAVQELMSQRRDALARLAAGVSPDGKATPGQHASLDAVVGQSNGLGKVVPRATGNYSTRYTSLGGGKNYISSGGKNADWGGSSSGDGSGALGALSNAYKTKDRAKLLDAISPGSSESLKGLSEVRYKVSDFLGGAGGPARTWSVLSKFSSGLSAVKGGLSSLKSSVKGGLSSIAGKAAGGLAAIGKKVQGGLSSLTQKVGGGLTNLASKGMNLATKTAKALGSGIKTISSKLGDAAASAWDASKHVVRTIGNGAKSLAQKTGGFFKGLWSKATGVVGAIGGKIKSGFSSVTNWIGDKAQKVGGALLSTTKAMGGGLQKLWAGTKNLAAKGWEATKSAASTAWGWAKKAGAATSNFLQSPAGQLLTTGLSLAASFIPGGLLVKGAIGAVVGAIDAVSKGGGWKEALMGAGAGALEGVLPVAKLGMVSKLALGGVKGGLQAAVNGGGFGDIAKGALGGAWETGGGAVLRKFGGGRGLKMVDGFLGGGKSTGVLGKLGQSKAVQWAYKGIKNNSTKIVKGGTWLWDKTEKLHGTLENVTKFGEYGSAALEGVSGLSGWAASKFDKDSGVGNFLQGLSENSAAGAEHLKTGTEYVKTVDEYVEGANKWLGFGLKMSGVNPKAHLKKQAAKDKRRKESLANSKELIESNPHLSASEKAERLKKWKSKADVWDRMDIWMDGTSKKVDDRLGGLRKTSSTALKKGLHALPGGESIMKMGKKGGDYLAWTHGQLTTVNKLVDTGVKHGKTVQSGLRNLIMLTEGADESQWGGGALQWVHEIASATEKDFSAGLDVAKQVQGVGHVTTGVTGGTLDFFGYDEAQEKKNTRDAQALAKENKKRADAGMTLLEADPSKKHKTKKDYEQESAWYWGLETAKDKDGKPLKTTRNGKPGAGEVHVAPWVKWDEASNGTEAEPTKYKKRIDQLAKWRKDLKKKADKAAKRNKKSLPLPPLDKMRLKGPTDDDAANVSRMDAGLRLLGGNAGDDEKQWEEYEARQQKKEAAAKTATASTPSSTMSAADVNKAVADATTKKLEEKATETARDLDKDEKHAAQQKSSAEAQVDAVHAIHTKLRDLKGRKDETKGAENPEARTQAYALLAEISWVQTQHGVDLGALQAEVNALCTHFNGGKAYVAADETPDAKGKKQKAGLEAVASGTPTTTLETVSTPDGVAGGMEEPGPSNGLSVLGTLNQGFLQKSGDASAVSDAPEFRLLSWYIDKYEETLLGDLPRLEQFAQTDPKQARVFYESLLREGGSTEFELARLERAYAPDSSQGRALVAFAERYAALRSRLKSVGKSAAQAELPAAPELELLRPDGQADPSETGGTATTEGKPTPGAGADMETYLGETTEDTWIGSGGAARSIADGLASGFKFDDEDGAEPTIGGALARLGGALQGLGGSVKGAAGDVNGLFGEVKGSAGILGDMAGTVGELVGAGKSNKVTEFTDKLSGFSAKVQEGADKVSGVSDQVTAAGGKLHEFGAKMEEKGFTLFGKVYRKGRAGTRDAAKAPVEDANRYLDAPKRLDVSVMSQMERFLGGRLGDVKIHTGRGADIITKRYDAEAVTIRDHIFFAPGRYNPHSTEGRKLLAHELTHVQQRGRPNLDTRTAEAEAHRNEALFGTPGMEILSLSTPQPDFHLNMAGADQVSGGVRTAKRQRSMSAGSGSFDEGVEGEELLDLVGERVYQLMLDDVEKDFENR